MFPEAIAEAIPEKFVVPVAPYVSAAPKRKNPWQRLPVINTLTLIHCCKGYAGEIPLTRKAIEKEAPDQEKPSPNRLLLSSASCQ